MNDNFEARFHPTQHRKQWITDLVNENDLKVGCEVGVHQGRTFKYVLDNCPGMTKHIAIDKWEGKDGLYEQWLEELKESLKDDPRAEFIRGFSQDVSDQVEDNSLDFVFIDGDHSFEGCARDIRHYAPKVKKGGWITGHDINLVEVKNAVSLYFNNTWKTAYDNIWYLRKE